MAAMVILEPWNPTVLPKWTMASAMVAGV